MTDSLSQLLAELPEAEPDALRASRVRARCHSLLATHRARLGERPTGRRLWEPVVVGLGGLYVAGAIRTALQVYGLL